MTFTRHLRIGYTNFEFNLTITWLAPGGGYTANYNSSPKMG